jgi:hypothetical protein
MNDSLTLTEFPPRDHHKVLSIPHGVTLSEFINKPKREFERNVSYHDSQDRLYRESTSLIDDIEVISPLQSSKELLVRVTDPRENFSLTNFFHDINPNIGENRYYLSFAICYYGNGVEGHYVGLKYRKCDFLILISDSLPLTVFFF